MGDLASSSRSCDDINATEQLDPFMASDLTSSSCAVVLSYAAPDVVRQAKLEAMDLKFRRKFLQPNTSLRDPHALRDPHTAGRSSVAVKVSSRTAGVASRDLVKSLVVPPALTEHGEEVRGSSEVILEGQRLEYQRPVRTERGRRDPQGASTPSYRTYDFAAVQQHTAEAGTGGRNWRGSSSQSATANGAGHRSVGGVKMGLGGSAAKGPGRGPGGRSELAAQLSEGVLTYLPARLDRPQGVDSTAFVPQTQAMADAQSKYDSVRTRRHSSAPPRRSVSMATIAAPSGRQAEPLAGVAGGSGGGGSRAGGGAAEGADTRDNGAAKLRNVTVVQVEETDLLAIYRQSSQHLLPKPAPPAAAPEPQPPRSSSHVIRATIQSHSAQAEPISIRPRGAGPATRAARFPDAAVPVKGPAAAASGGSERQAVSEPPGGATSTPGHQQPPSTAVAGMAIARRSTAGPSSAPSSPLRRAGGAGSTLADAPAAVLQAAWDAPAPAEVPTSSYPPTGPTRAASPGRGGTARSAPSHSTPNAWKSPRPPSPASRPPARNVAQRRASAPSTAARAAAGPQPAASALDGAGGSGAAGQRRAPSSRPSSAASASAHGGSAPSRMGSIGAHLVDPATRRQQQHSGTSGTAKTNMWLRGPARGAGSDGGGPFAATVGRASAASEGSAARPHSHAQPQPAWAASTLARGGGSGAAGNRSALQERILDGLMRQYRAGPGEEVAEDAGTGGVVAAEGSSGATVLTTHPYNTPRRPTSGRGSSGGDLDESTSMRSQQSRNSGDLQQQQQQTHQPAARPQSAPNRRVRPPSAGHWAGRPDPEALALRSGASRHSKTMVYDPELQPSPLDSYVNQLVGLD